MISISELIMEAYIREKRKVEIDYLIKEVEQEAKGIYERWQNDIPKR